MSINLRIFLTLFSAVFVTTIGAGLVVPLLPVYAHDLGANAFQVGLIFSSFSLTRSIFVPYFGKLSDNKGKKPLLTTGLLLYFLLSLLYAASNNIFTLVLLRLGQGFASAMILPVAQTYVGMITPAQKEGKIMGIFNISLYGGLSIGPLLGGIVTDYFNIKVSFLAMGALTLLGFFLCLFLLPRETEAAAINPENRRRATPYLELMKRPSAASLFIFRFCFTMGIGIIWTFLPLLASAGFGLSCSAIGFLVTINVFVSGLLQAPMGLLADRFNKKALVTISGALGVIAIGYLITADSFGELALANGLLGLAGGISMPAIMALAVIEGRRTKAMGSLMGLLALAHSLGMLVGPLLAGLLVDIFSFGAIFAFGACILSAGTIIFFRYH